MGDVAAGEDHLLAGRRDAGGGRLPFLSTLKGPARNGSILGNDYFVEGDLDIGIGVSAVQDELFGGLKTVNIGKGRFVPDIAGRVNFVQNV